MDLSVALYGIISEVHIVQMVNLLFNLDRKTFLEKVRGLEKSRLVKVIPPASVDLAVPNPAISL